jgi:hypothetical protein
MNKLWWGAVLPVVAAGCVSDNDLFNDFPPEPQANPPDLENPTQTDVIVQVTTPMVDVLWTIDNSCSMFDEQQALTDNFPKFMDYFLGSGLDYHIGVVSTDTDDLSHKGKLQTGGTPYKFIDTDTPNAIGVFTSMASMGTTGSATERGMGASYLALETHKDTFNAGFQRDEAAIHTIVLSDEMDLTQASVVTEPEFINWYDGLKEEADERTFSSIVSFQTGGTYIHISEEIGGIIWDITEENYSVVLDRLGVQAAGLKREYFLSQLPVLGTITVAVTDPVGTTFYFDEAVAVTDPVTGVETFVGDWIYDPSRNSITFLEYIPEELAKVTIHYEIESTRQDAPDEPATTGTGGTNATDPTP